uniref:BTB domain-containing protein n=1 Tax=Angiostrongylus cantonensis TaxID=6313 RepID=A0A158PBK5_ANGCA
MSLCQLDLGPKVSILVLANCSCIKCRKEDDSKFLSKGTDQPVPVSCIKMLICGAEDLVVELLCDFYVFISAISLRFHWIANAIAFYQAVKSCKHNQMEEVPNLHVIEEMGASASTTIHGCHSGVVRAKNIDGKQRLHISNPYNRVQYKGR